MMGHPMMHHPSHGSSDDWTKMFFIPIPMAMFGVIISFMFGATIGSMIGRKHAAMGAGGHGPMAWKHGMGMMGMGMMGMKHHHHGEGTACRCGDWPESSEQEHAIDPMK